MHNYQQLSQHYAKISDIGHLVSIASWDEAVMMPKGGGPSRAKAMSTIAGIRHQMGTEPCIGDWIDKAKSEDLSEWQRVNVARIEHNYVNATCLPESLVVRAAEASMICEQAWRYMRAENNWQDFMPLLQEVLTIQKDIAQIKSAIFQLSPYDVLIDSFSPGMTQAKIDPIFAELKACLPSMLKDITSQQVNPQPFTGPFDIEKQKTLGQALMKIIGFDFDHGRLDVSHHPFCGGVSDDIRITTRYSAEEFISSVMGVCHETGHAMYERGLPKEYASQPVGQALGMTVHESQSLLVEMQACRSKPFMHVIKRELEKVFGKQQAFSVDNLYQHYTFVSPGLIRVDADEVSYPLHVILRYDIEKQLIEGDLDLKDLPEVWDAYMQQYLGLSTKGNYKDGVMQDVHWPSGAFGYFPAYTLGAMTAAQVYKKAQETIPSLPIDIEQGNFTALMHFLSNNVHQYGSRYNYDDLMMKATGSPLSSEAFVNHLRARYQI